jgi:6-phosphogluconolactonase (cycloisomerase 2 family)
MKNSVHDNGGFIGRVADYAATDYYQISGGYSAYSFAFDNITFGINSQLTKPTGLFFKPDGTLLFVVGRDKYKVFSYGLTTAWDLSTASYTGDSFSVSSQTSIPSGIHFKPDGTKLYITGEVTNSISEYSLSTAWDITTASITTAGGVTSEELGVLDITFKPDGTKFYTVGWRNGDVHEYSMTTAWDISTKSFSGNELSLNSQVGAPTDIAFNSDGTIMYAVGESNYFASWDLSTAYDVSTATFNSRFSVTSNTRGISFKSDYSKLYLVEFDNDTVRQYSASGGAVYGNKKNTGVWSMDADYLNAELKPATIPTNGLIAHLDPANYTSGTTFADVSGNNNNFTLAGSPTHNTTNGGTFSFTTSQSMTTPNSGDMDRNTLDYTVIYAAKINSITSDRERVLTSASNNWLLGFWDGIFNSYFANSWVYNPSARDTNWRIFSATRNHSADQDVLYSNGVSVVSNSSGTNGFRGLSVNNGIYSEDSNCEVGILLVYDRVLTSTEITQVYDIYKSRYGLT